MLYCKQHGMGAALGGTANETDQSARICTHIGLACRPDFMLSKPGLGVDEALMIQTQRDGTHAGPVAGEAQPVVTRRSAMRSGLSRLRSAACLVLSGALAAAGSNAAGPETPRHGGTAVTVLGADPADPQPRRHASACPTSSPAACVYDALVRFGKNFEIVPNLAKSWEISADGLTYTFHLEKAAFTDGKPVTSEDVKFTLHEV